MAEPFVFECHPMAIASDPVEIWILPPRLGSEHNRGTALRHAAIRTHGVRALERYIQANRRIVAQINDRIVDIVNFSSTKIECTYTKSYRPVHTCGC